MKKLTKKQMKKLKGMLNDMDYTLTGANNTTTSPQPITAPTQATVCKVCAMHSDED